MDLTLSPRSRAIATRLTPAAVPTAAQVRWQTEELALFVHFTVNTFTDAEWGDGTESPQIFNPTDLDAGQWARVAKEGGFGTLILTAKHHDGFCLWPTATTEHSVASSPWRDGQGDVVREAAEACAAEGVRFGLYCSPWDRNAPSYGTGRDYDDFYIAQLTELLTNYGELSEVWFDGAVGATERGRQVYDWERIFGTVKRLQPNAVIFSDAGPGVRWVGNESGVADRSSWSTIDPTRVDIPGDTRAWTMETLAVGDPEGAVWRPAETDVSIRPGWFWHESENEQVRSGDNLMGIYLSSVGRNSKLLLNLPPNTAGRFDDSDVASLEAFTRVRTQTMATDLLEGSAVEVDAEGALVISLPAPVSGTLLGLGEDISLGQQVSAFRVQVDRGDGQWRPLVSGSTIGYRRIIPIPDGQLSRLRVLIDASYGEVALSWVGLHLDARGVDKRRADSHD